MRLRVLSQAVSGVAFCEEEISPDLFTPKMHLTGLMTASQPTTTFFTSTKCSVFTH